MSCSCSPFLQDDFRALRPKDLPSQQVSATLRPDVIGANAALQGAAEGRGWRRSVQLVVEKPTVTWRLPGGFHQWGYPKLVGFHHQ